MGILTDGRGRKTLTYIVTSHCNKICFLSYLAGIFWFCALSDSNFNNRTYFSENALLPGQVKTEFDNADAAYTIMHELDRMTKKEKKHIPVSWLSNKMSSIGLQTYTQNFTISLPLPDSKGTSSIKGTNIYGVLRAPRIAGTEALVFSLPYKKGKNLGGIALLLSLAEYFRGQSYWSKDIIFLVTDQGVLGMHSWLEAYHDIPNPYLKSLPLDSHSGPIQAAINVEMQSDFVDGFNLVVEGINGQLPNLDLINMVNRLCSKEGIMSKLNTQSYYGNDELVSMVKMMLNQASGLPTGNHGLFHRYRIEAVTMRGVTTRSKGSRGFDHTGRLFEGIFRSLNNLMERFHQSFFFYLLPAPYRYVSIGLYMPPFCCLLLGPMITSIMLWAVTGNPTVGYKNTAKTSAKAHGNKGAANARNKEKEVGTTEKVAGTIEKGAGTIDKGAGTTEKGAGTMEKGAGTIEKGAGTMEKGAGTKDKRGKKSEHEKEENNKPDNAAEEGTKDEKRDENKGVEEEKDKETETTRKETKPKIDESTLREKVGFAWNPQRVSGVFPIVMVTYLGGSLLYYSPYLGYEMGVAMEMDGIKTALASTCCVFVMMIMTPFIHRLVSKPASMANLYLVKCVALVIFSVTMASLGALNFSLAFLICVLTIPAILIAGPTQNMLRRLFQVFLLLVASPVSILFILCSVYVALSSDSLTLDNDSLHFVLSKANALVYKAAMSAVRDSQVLGMWSFSIACVGLMPNWTLFWYLAWQ